mmetsp:Transcript_35079/g.77301  ORF Transcript_35079/g.77301 Transcript_35079/m.77301 type:complete len:565 (+) Transcript_35079:991-2685(+)
MRPTSGCCQHSMVQVVVGLFCVLLYGPQVGLLHPPSGLGRLGGRERLLRRLRDRHSSCRRQGREHGIQCGLGQGLLLGAVVTVHRAEGEAPFLQHGGACLDIRGYRQRRLELIEVGITQQRQSGNLVRPSVEEVLEGTRLGYQLRKPLLSTHTLRASAAPRHVRPDAREVHCWEGLLVHLCRFRPGCGYYHPPVAADFAAVSVLRSDEEQLAILSHHGQPSRTAERRVRVCVTADRSRGAEDQRVHLGSDGADCMRRVVQGAKEQDLVVAAFRGARGCEGRAIELCHHCRLQTVHSGGIRAARQRHRQPATPLRSVGLRLRELQHLVLVLRNSKRCEFHTLCGRSCPDKLGGQQVVEAQRARRSQEQKRQTAAPAHMCLRAWLDKSREEDLLPSRRHEEGRLHLHGGGVPQRDHVAVGQGQQRAIRAEAHCTGGAVPVLERIGARPPQRVAHAARDLLGSCSCSCSAVQPLPGNQTCGASPHFHGAVHGGGGAHYGVAASTALRCSQAAAGEGQRRHAKHAVRIVHLRVQRVLGQRVVPLPKLQRAAGLDVAAPPHLHCAQEVT